MEQVFDEDEGKQLDSDPIGALKKALNNNDTMRVARAYKVLIDRNLHELDTCIDEFVAATMQVNEWRSSLKIGDLLDTYCERDKIWYSSKVVQINERDILIHYQGWRPKYDTVYLKGSMNLQPYCSMTRKEYRGKSGRKQPGSQPLPEKMPKTENAEKIHFQDSSVVQILTKTKSGREVKKTINLMESQPSIAPISHDKKEKKAKDLDQEVDNNDGYCYGCLECNDNLVCCDGPCLRSFCLGCLELEKVPEEDQWECDDCRRKEHQCLICQEHGEDGKAKGVFKCSRKGCGRFYHQSCAVMHAGFVFKHAPQRLLNPETGEGSEDGDQEEAPPKFICASHTCATCSEFYVDRKEVVFSCARCPVGFHVNCITPGSVYHELCLLCHSHDDLALPPLPDELSILSTEPSRVMKAIEREKQMKEKQLEEQRMANSWTTKLTLIANQTLPKKAPLAHRSSDPSHFRLPLQITNDLDSRPLPFQHISSLKYLTKHQNPVEPSSRCICQTVCDDACLNRMLTTECMGRGPEDKGKKKKIEIIYENCALGQGCGNRSLQNRDYAKTQPFKEGKMGWGLRTLHNIPPGKLVIEYIGDVLDEKQMEKRLEEQTQRKEKAFYIMQLDSGLYVDARHRGNLSRYINHSCDPNCELQKWTVAGLPRIGIVAKREIRAGESLSYDYQFSTQEEDFFACQCGAKRCRGTMAPKKFQSPQAKKKVRLTNKKKKQLVKHLKMQKEKCEAKLVETNKRRLSLTSRFLPGDPVLEVRNGPPKKFYKNAKESRLFLLKNVETGSNFLRRKYLWQSRSLAVS